MNPASQGSNLFSWFSVHKASWGFPEPSKGVGGAGVSSHKMAPFPWLDFFTDC